MSNMDVRKPLYLKTYGRQRRKLSAWISPENRKQAFDSTPSSEGDISVFEPAKPAIIRAMRPGKADRPAKRKTKCLTENSSDEENISRCPPPRRQPAQKSKTTREKKTSVCSSRAVRPVRKKTILVLSENSSDEENISVPLPPQSKTTRKSRLVSVPGTSMTRKRQHDQTTSKSEEDSCSSTKSHKTSVQMERTSNHLPSAGRFVTRRRCAVSTKSKLPKAIVSILNSSDDFACGGGAFSSNRFIQPSKRRRIPPLSLVSSVENSVNAVGTSTVATNVFREISLNESADHSLGPGSMKPIFCSTPSASSFSKQPHKPFPINDLPSPPSMSASFHEDLDSPGQPRTAQTVALHSGVKQQSSLGEKQPSLHYNEETSGELCLQLKNMNKTNSCSEAAKSHGENSKTTNSGTLPSLYLLTTDNESSSHFLSAAGGLEWLIDALKEKCLTQRCTVQLERLTNLTVTQLCNQTTYSSCLDHSSSGHSQPTNENLLSMDNGNIIEPLSSSKPPLHLHSSVTNDANSDHLQSVNSFESLATDSQSTNLSPSVNYKQSVENSSAIELIEQSASVLYAGSTHCIDSSIDFVMGTQLSADKPVQTLFTGEAVNNRRFAKKCTVQLKTLSLSQQTVQQVNRFRETGLDCADESVDPDANASENARSREIGKRMLVVRQSANSAVTQPPSNDLETLKTTLKEKCLSDKPIVAINNITLSQLKDILQCKDTNLKSPADVSDSGSDDRTKRDRQSERNTDHRKGDNSSINVSVKKKDSSSSENNISSDKDVIKNSCDVLPERRKALMAPREKKRRSTSTDRPGTTRKACVSGLSVSRWKTKNSANPHMFKSRTERGSINTVDCSISELTTQPKHLQKLFGNTMNFSTPVRASRLNFSSLLADLTPNTHTWSRLKAALSVHRKGMVLLTPRSLRPSVLGSPGRVELADTSHDLFATPLRTPLSKRLQSQLLSCDSPVVCEDADLSDAEKVYAECSQEGPLPWEECILPQRMKQCVKIGEGTFGEVFSTTNALGDMVALKIIPLEGSEKVNGEDQKSFGEILHEIIISKELSSLKEKQQNQTHSFIGLNDLHCVRGCYPPDFMNAWDTFDQQKGSENDRPDFFGQDQIFIILEFEFGGIDLENSNGTLASLGVAKSILHQVTAALAVAEEELNFEHRDLHWGNILVKTTNQKKHSFLLNGTAHSVETKGVLVRIIDYSLSRLEIDELTVSCDISEDEELFMGQGDYQFDIYRLMRQENGSVLF
ncbi:hypothetical protein PAMA_016377 [Pampus argenteus]